MFEQLSDKLALSFKKLTGKGKLTEANISDALIEVRNSLLEADVALSVVDSFIDSVKQEALGTQVAENLDPTQQFIKIINEKLTQVMGAEKSDLILKGEPPIILFSGLQGVGKTTSVAKLARYLKETGKQKIMVVSTDIYRPAAIDQLKVLAEEVGVSFFESTRKQKPVDIAKAARKEAKLKFYDALLVDTAGRLAIDKEMMKEISSLQKALNPSETLLVVDSMSGQDAANTAKEFASVLPLTGVILTKIDGDARGGAALSVRQITGKPIKFLGAGEKTTALEVFHPERIASRILGMGDIMSLIEEADKKLDAKKAERLTKKVIKGKGFDLEDFREQLEQMRSMGGMMKIMEKMPGMGQLAKMANTPMLGKEFDKMEVIINSMTMAERRKPELLNGSRKRRICTGSGTQIQDLNRLMKQHKQMQKMSKKMVGGKMKNMMRGMGLNMQGMDLDGLPENLDMDALQKEMPKNMPNLGNLPGLGGLPNAGGLPGLGGMKLPNMGGKKR